MLMHDFLLGWAGCYESWPGPFLWPIANSKISSRIQSHAKNKIKIIPIFYTSIHWIIDLDNLRIYILDPTRVGIMNTKNLK